MSHILKRDQRRGGRGRFHGRQRWRMRPTCLELEGRALLSTIVVNNPTDTPVAGETDLRQAIALANTNGGAETITFDKTVFNTPQTINLDPALGQLELSDQTGTETITGPRAGVTIKGNYTTPGVANSVFEIEPGATATLSGLTITGGNNPIFGGGVDDYGTATLIDCTISGNPGGGGFVNNFGSATLIDCTISDNVRRLLRIRRRRRGVELRNNHAHQLHDQRQLGTRRAAGWSTMAARSRLPTATSAATPPNTAAGGFSTRPASDRIRHDHAHQLHDQRQLGPIGRRAGKHQRRDDARQLHRRQQPGRGLLRLSPRLRAAAS